MGNIKGSILREVMPPATQLLKKRCGGDIVLGIDGGWCMCNIIGVNFLFFGLYITLGNVIMSIYI